MRMQLLKRGASALAARSARMAHEVVLSLPRVDDWHLHVRDGEGMASLMRQLPRVVARAIIMPNLKPPVTTTAHALAYRDRILAATPAAAGFTPLMTLYLTDGTTPDEISRAHASGHVHAVKLYPAGATTNSDSGVTSMDRVMPALSRMAELRMPLLVHGEVTDPSVDVFDREAVFLDRVLRPLVAALPTLRIVLEHITTRAAVEFVLAAGDNVAATITAHHLLYNRNALFEGGIRPHRYCLPILKHEDDRQALLRVIASGHARFFAGTDSAPHGKASKECACGAAGMFTAHAGLELYALAFESMGALQHLKAFMCDHGAAFYGLPTNATLDGDGVHVELRREDWVVPPSYEFGPDATVVPAKAGETLPWKAYAVGK